MTRERWFCYLCGAVTSRPPDELGRSYCRGHSAVAAAVDSVPPDPFESLPMQAAQMGEDAQARKGKAI